MSTNATVHEPGQTAAGRTPMLEAADITKHFRVRVGRFGRGTVHAAENISLALYPGTVTAVVGESGSGKSTLTRMLARTHKLTSGKLYFQGQEVDLSKAGIAGLPQRGAAGVAGSVRLAQPGAQRPLYPEPPADPARQDRRRPAGDDPGSAAPGGIGTGRAVHRQVPARTVRRPAATGCRSPGRSRSNRRCSSPTNRLSMLDVSIRLGVLNLLADLRDSDQLAILYVTHDIASARYLADRIMVMYAGQVVEFGSADTIANAPAHPYTQLLLSAAPDPDVAETTWLGASGTPPSLVDPPTGCRFHPRLPVRDADLLDATSARLRPARGARDRLLAAHPGTASPGAGATVGAGGGLDRPGSGTGYRRGRPGSRSLVKTDRPTCCAGHHAAPAKRAPPVGPPDLRSFSAPTCSGRPGRRRRRY